MRGETGRMQFPLPPFPTVTPTGREGRALLDLDPRKEFPTVRVSQVTALSTVPHL